MFQDCRRSVMSICSLILLLVWCLLPSIGIANSNSMSVLTETFDNKITTLSTKDTFEIQYCPDNTCVTFQINGENKDVLTDFVVLYLFYASGYTLLVFPDGEGLTDIDRIRPEAEKFKNRYLGNCTGNDLEAASCMLTGLVKTYGIIGFDVRYDEGDKHITTTEMLERVALERLESTRDWRKKHFSKKKSK